MRIQTRFVRRELELMKYCVEKSQHERKTFISFSSDAITVRRQSSVKRRRRRFCTYRDNRHSSSLTIRFNGCLQLSLGEPHFDVVRVLGVDQSDVRHGAGIVLRRTRFVAMISPKDVLRWTSSSKKNRVSTDRRTQVFANRDVNQYVEDQNQSKWNDEGESSISDEPTECQFFRTVGILSIVCQ